jgi:hypothetical protein
MAFADVTITVTYEPIGDHHLLVHMYCRKIIDQWMLLDLADISSRTGQSHEQIIEKLTRRKEVQ